MSTRKIDVDFSFKQIRWLPLKWLQILSDSWVPEFLLYAARPVKLTYVGKKVNTIHVFTAENIIRSTPACFMNHFERGEVRSASQKRIYDFVAREDRKQSAILILS